MSRCAFLDGCAETRGRTDDAVGRGRDEGAGCGGGGSAGGEHPGGGVARVRVEPHELELVADVAPEGGEDDVAMPSENLVASRRVGTAQPDPGRELRTILRSDRPLRRGVAGMAVVPVMPPRVVVRGGGQSDRPEAGDALAPVSSSEDVLNGTFGAGPGVDPRPLGRDRLEARDDLRGRDRLLVARGRGDHGGHVLPACTAHADGESRDCGEKSESESERATEGNRDVERVHESAPFKSMEVAILREIGPCRQSAMGCRGVRSTLFLCFVESTSGRTAHCNFTSFSSQL